MNRSSRSNQGRRQRQPRRAAAAASSSSREAATTTTSDVDDLPPSQSLRKRSAVVSADRRKKSRSEVKPESSIATTGAPTTSAAERDRYPLRSRAPKSTSTAATGVATKRGGHGRSSSVGSGNSVLRLPPQAITPASEAPPRHINFGGDENVPSLFGSGPPTCRCPKHCSHREITAFEYLKHYGEDVFRDIKEREAREYAALPSLSTRRQGSHHESSTISSPASAKDEDEIAPNSPSSTNSVSTSSSPATPRPESVIGTRQRARLGDKTMRFLEEPTELLDRQPHVTQRMRAVLVSWLVEVSIEYNVSTAAYHLAISLLDHVLSCGPTLREQQDWGEIEGDRYSDDDDDDDDDDEPNWPSHRFVVRRDDFQALGCACLWLASKLEDRDPPLMDDFCYISDQSVSAFALRNMESRICKVMEFRLQRVTPFHFLPTFLRASRHCHDSACVFQSPVQHNMVLYLITLGRLSYNLTRYGPSVLAAAAVYLSRATLNMTERNNDDEEHGKYWSATLAHYTGYSKDDLKNPVFLLYHYQLKAEELNVAVYHQFSKSKFDSVSVRTVRRVEELGYGSHVSHDFLDVEC
eukprot:scaffold84_cov163-Amphora_coffeaeformis.AAC.10